MQEGLFESHIESLPLIHRGKVRDLYALGQEHLLIVTTDRLSAFDVVLPQPIPGKGLVLSELTAFWMQRFESRIPNHFAGAAVDLARYLRPDELAQCAGRGVAVRKLRALPVEAVARGYLIGSGWKDYQATGEVCGVALPPGLQLAGKLHLIDEVLTPDSSRFWPAAGYRPGISPPSFDKQYVRDYLETLDWNKTAPGPPLPDEVVLKTAEKYREAQRLLTGQ